MPEMPDNPNKSARLMRLLQLVPRGSRRVVRRKPDQINLVKPGNYVTMNRKAMKKATKGTITYPPPPGDST